MTQRSYRSRFIPATLALVAGLGACAAQALPASESYAQRFVGPWRVERLTDAQLFSDYVLSADGTLTHLLAVADGKPVDADKGAGEVRAPNEAGPMSCYFGTAWHSQGLATLVVSGRCSDGGTRDIELSFEDTNTRSTENVTVRTVGGQSGWSQPSAWLFQKCDLHPCGE